MSMRIAKTAKTFTIYANFPKWNDDNKDCGPQDFGGSPHSYTVTLGKQVLASFGDDYHDRGQDKSEGFIEGYAKAKGWEYHVAHEDRIHK